MNAATTPQPATLRPAECKRERTNGGSPVVRVGLSRTGGGKHAQGPKRQRTRAAARAASIRDAS